MRLLLATTLLVSFPAAAAPCLTQDALCWIEQARLMSLDAEAGDFFGNSVGLFGDNRSRSGVTTISASFFLEQVHWR